MPLYLVTPWSVLGGDGEWGKGAGSVLVSSDRHNHRLGGLQLRHSHSSRGHSPRARCRPVCCLVRAVLLACRGQLLTVLTWSFLCAHRRETEIPGVPVSSYWLRATASDLT